MYRCNDCGADFGNPKIERDDWEEYYVCPRCGSEELDEMQPCAVCGNPAYLGETLCSSCKTDFENELNDFIKTMCERFSFTRDQVIEMIGELLEF